MSKIEAIFVGGSAGGVTAIQRLLKSLPEDFSLPIIVVLHLPSSANINPSLVFGDAIKLKIFEATDKTQIRPGHIYFAAANYHLLIEKDFSFGLSQDEPIHYSRPSIDVLFETAALAYGDKACGVLLTGANSDGAAGLKFIQSSGGLAFVQKPEEAEVKTMPMAAIAIMKPDFIGSLKEIADKIRRLAEAV